MPDGPGFAASSDVGLVRTGIVVLEPVRRADLRRRDLEDVAVGDADEPVALADLARVAEAGLELGLDERAGPVVPDDLGPAPHQEPGLGLGVVDLQREAPAGVDVEHLADVRPVGRRPHDLVPPGLLDPDREARGREARRRRGTHESAALSEVIASIGPGSTSLSSAR